MAPYSWIQVALHLRMKIKTRMIFLFLIEMEI